MTIKSNISFGRIGFKICVIYGKHDVLFITLPKVDLYQNDVWRFLDHQQPHAIH